MSKLRNGSIAQPGEHLPYKQGVTGSSPVVPTSFSIAYASVAQLVEQGTENPRVVGSIPTGGTSDIKSLSADLAHLVERDLAKVEVAGSSPVIRYSGHVPQQNTKMCA